MIWQVAYVAARKDQCKVGMRTMSDIAAVGELARGVRVKILEMSAMTVGNPLENIARDLDVGNAEQRVSCAAAQKGLLVEQSIECQFAELIVQQSDAHIDEAIGGSAHEFESKHDLNFHSDARIIFGEASDRLWNARLQAVDDAILDRNR